MTHEEAVAKAVKLLRLATSSNPNEAALAASKAQEIIDRHNIQSAALTLAQNGRAEPDEPIKDFGCDPLDPGVGKIATWTWRLFLVIGNANGCKGYAARNHGGGIGVVGRPSDVATVRYLYAWLRKEVDRLAARDARGFGATYANNFRNGVVDTIGQRMEAQRKETQAATVREAIEEAKAAAPEAEQAQAGQFAMIRVNNAIARVEKRGEETQDWIKKNMKLRSGSATRSRVDSGARQAGRTAGHEVRINSSRGNIGRTTPQLH